MTLPVYLIGLSHPQTISRRKGCLLNESNAQSFPRSLPLQEIKLLGVALAPEVSRLLVPPSRAMPRRSASSRSDCTHSACVKSSITEAMWSKV